MEILLLVAQIGQQPILVARYVAFFGKTDGSGICPTGFRVPTSTELENGRKSWPTDNPAGAFEPADRATGRSVRFKRLFSQHFKQNSVKGFAVDC